MKIAPTAPGGGGDAPPSSVIITSPASGAWTGNSIEVKASATDDVGLTSIKVYANGGVALQATCSGVNCTLAQW